MREVQWLECVPEKAAPFQTTIAAFGALFLSPLPYHLSSRSISSSGRVVD